MKVEIWRTESAYWEIGLGHNGKKVSFGHFFKLKEHAERMQRRIADFMRENTDES